MLYCLHLDPPQRSTEKASFLVSGSSRTDLFFQVCSMRAGYKDESLLWITVECLLKDVPCMRGKVWVGTVYSFKHSWDQPTISWCKIWLAAHPSFCKPSSLAEEAGLRPPLSFQSVVDCYISWKWAMRKIGKPQQKPKSQFQLILHLLPSPLQKKKKKSFASSPLTGETEAQWLSSAHERRLPGPASCTSVSSCVKGRWWWLYSSSWAAVRTQSDYPGSGFWGAVLGSWHRVHTRDLFAVNSPIPRYRRSLGLYSFIKPSWHQMK